MREEGFLTTDDGVDIWYGLAGQSDAPVLVLTDGIGCDGFIWPHVMDYFHDHMTIVRWHYRGHGRSGAPDDPEGLTLQRLAADLGAILEHLGIDEAVIAGHSMGVQVSLEFYRAYPERVSSLILICGSYGRPLSTFQGSDMGETLLPYIRAAMERAPRLLGAVWSSLLPTGVSYRIAQATEINADRVRKVEFFPYLEHASRMDPTTFVGMLQHAASHDAEALLPDVKVPTLVVAGDLDGFTPGRLSEKMADEIPRGELFRLAQGTHTAPIEFPEAMNARLHRFMAAQGLLSSL